MKRRHLLGGLGAILGVSALTWPDKAARAGSKDSRFVFVTLRGGMDGLAAVPAVGDPAYVSARGAIALPVDKTLPLDGIFALHPGLAALYPMYQQGEMACVHATGLSFQTRSHFDAQDLLESGGGTPQSQHSGWLNRSLSKDCAPGYAVAISRTVPLLARGDNPVTAVDPLRRKDARPSILTRLDALYQQDSVLATALMDGLASRDKVRTAQGDVAQTMMKGDRNSRFSQSIEVVGRMMADPAGPRVAALESTGWDTHAAQGTVSGNLANRFKRLAGALIDLKRGLGPAWKETVVVVASEFGRTVHANGTKGTDHGSGGVVLLLGGAVAGGQVRADWPGLAKPKLFQGRDLRTTTDIRSIFKGVLHDHMGLTRSDLDRLVFPGSREVSAMHGLVV